MVTFILYLCIHMIWEIIHLHYDPHSVGLPYNLLCDQLTHCHQGYRPIHCCGVESHKTRCLKLNTDGIHPMYTELPIIPKGFPPPPHNQTASLSLPLIEEYIKLDTVEM